MFDLSEKRLVWIPVTWPGVKAKGDDLAEPVEHEIGCQVELVDTERIREILGAETSLSELDKFKALVVDWRGVKLGKANAPMTDEHVAKMLRVPMFANGFERSYLAAWAGRIEERQKNLSASSTAGPEGGAPEQAET